MNASVVCVCCWGSAGAGGSAEPALAALVSRAGWTGDGGELLAQCPSRTAPSQTPLQDRSAGGSPSAALRLTRPQPARLVRVPGGTATSATTLPLILFIESS